MSVITTRIKGELPDEIAALAVVANAEGVS
jgi:hypothetical protein